MTTGMIMGMTTIMHTSIAITAITPMRPNRAMILIAIMTTGIRTMITTTTMPPHGGMPMGPNRKSSPDPAAGGAG
jgi:hypothetical protein